MTGKDLALSVIEQYGTNDVVEISQKVSVTIYYERWEAVTYGEYNRKKESIHINLNAPIPINEILAHELGHYFIHRLDNQWTKEEEEKIVEEFAQTIRIHFP